jgi:hypothetical protein
MRAAEPPGPHLLPEPRDDVGAVGQEVQRPRQHRGRGLVAGDEQGLWRRWVGSGWVGSDWIGFVSRFVA